MRPALPAYPFSTAAGRLKRMLSFRSVDCVNVWRTNRPFQRSPKSENELGVPALRADRWSASIAKKDAPYYSSGGVSDRYHSGISLLFSYGAPGSGWVPISGDWDADGTTNIGLYNPGASAFFLRYSNTAGPADVFFNYGPPGAGCKPLAGNWSGL
jgi:hypothetical protein